MTDKEKVYECLKLLNPSTLTYEEWLHVGMAIESVHGSFMDWDEWSKADSRYRQDECRRKWDSFKGNGAKVGLGTLCHIVINQGLSLPFKSDYDGGKELDWDDWVEEAKPSAIVDTSWLEDSEIIEPKIFDEKSQVIEYLQTVFEPSEYVGYVFDSWHHEELKKWLPSRGHCNKTCEQLISELRRYDEIEYVFGDYNKEVGAWIRFNPLDGKGVKDENITAYRYALVESDDLTIEKQYSLIKKLELPVKILTHSGGKSLHAIVNIDADNYDEYRKRVDYLYKILLENNFKVDKQNKNPSRLSRIAGVYRGDKKQFIVAKNIGQRDFETWQEWIEEQKDDLPDMQCLDNFFDNPPEKSPELIEGVLRQGHKLLLAGPSKAGKSFCLIQLANAIAEGGRWLGWQCAQGKVLYVNLEVDHASCIHRFKDVYNAKNLEPLNVHNIDIWNLRGKAVALDKLAPKLIRRALKNNYIAVIIDPIYKVITGDENSAEQMSKFCNQFDKICAELQTATIYCHHHSKGVQGQKKSADRASGSGVFARDPDALLDLTELEIDEDIRKAMHNVFLAEKLGEFLDSKFPNWRIEMSPDDLLVGEEVKKEAERLYQKPSSELSNKIYEIKERIEHMTAWQIEGTLREFASFKPIRSFFSYPIHVPSKHLLDDADFEGEVQVHSRAKNSKKKKESSCSSDLVDAYNALYFDEDVLVSEMAEYFNVSEKTIYRRIKSSKEFNIDKGKVIKK